MLDKLPSGELLGNPAGTWLMAIIALVVTAVVLYGLRRFTLSRLQRIASRSPRRRLLEQIAELGRRTNTLLLIVAFVVGTALLDLPGPVYEVLQAALILALLLQAAIMGGALITAWLSHYREARLEDDPSSVTTISALGILAKSILYVVVVIVALDNVGFEVSTLIAGLGIAGIAVGLALQNVLGDLFASLVIVLDKPFVIGDFLVVGDYMGTVERIGIKTTRLQGLGGEHLVFSNTDLVSSRVSNYQRMTERRIVFSFGVIYQTPYEKLKRIPDIVEEVVGGVEGTRFDRAHFSSYGDSSLDFEVVYYVLTKDYAAYMDAQQEINFGLFARFEQEGLEFAYPTRTVFLEK